jgi:hypothetical protein
LSLVHSSIFAIDPAEGQRGFRAGPIPPYPRLAPRVLVGGPASDWVLTSYGPPQASVTQGLMQAFLYQRAGSIRYQDQSGTLTDRGIETQYLYYNMPVWYALAWDRLRDDVRFFRLDRLQQIQPLAAEFRLRRPDPFLNAGEHEGPHHVAAVSSTSSGQSTRSG